MHGELRHMSSEHARLAREVQVPEAVVLQNGDMLRLAPGKAEVIDEAPAGRLHLDGDILVHEDEGIAKARRSLAYGGFIGVTLVLDRKGRLAVDPVVHIEGIPEEVIEPVKDAILRTMNGKRRGGDTIAEQVRIAARRAANDVWARSRPSAVETVEV